MANQEHLDILKQGVEVWNAWRQRNANIVPDLSEADLRATHFNGADLRGALFLETHLQNACLAGAKLMGSDLVRANLEDANLADADLTGADFRGANLHRAILTRAKLSGADLRGAFLSNTYLAQADLSRAQLQRATLVETNVEQATLTECSIYGLSVWNIQGTPKHQSNLVITRDDEPTITVDDLEVAQFIYLMLNNQKIRNVIDTVTSKAVLILGRFTEERKPVLNALRDALRQRNYLPILFDFDKPRSRDLTETVATLAGMVRFVVADLTDAKSIPQELSIIAPVFFSVAIQPIILETQYEYAMFEHFRRLQAVLPIYQYADMTQLIATLAEQVIAPAEQKARELAPPAR